MNWEAIVFSVSEIILISLTAIFASKPWNILIPTITLIIFTILVIYLKTREKQFYYLPMNKHKDIENFIGAGTLEYIKNENCFRITKSQAGFIFRKTLTWDDYKFKCDFKIQNSSFGIILRAQDLSNYLLIQMFTSRIRPHIRIDGYWSIDSPWEQETAGLNLSKDEWYSLEIYCEKRKIRICINWNTISEFDRTWMIPERVLINLKKQDGQEIPIAKEVFFDYGAIGIRNSGKESALFKNILVKKL